MKWMQLFLVVVVTSVFNTLPAADETTPAPQPAPAPATPPTAAPAMPPVAGPSMPADAGAAAPATGAAAPGTPGAAADPGAAPATTSLPKAQEPAPSFLGQLGGMLPLLLIFGFFFYFMLIRPEQKRRKEHENMLNTIKKGTTVVTSSGIFGVVQDVQGDTILVTIDQANKVTVKMQKGFITAVTGAAAGAPAGETK